MTIPYAEVIGDPIAHSKSPLIHNFWLEKLGLDCDFRRTRVRPDQLAPFLSERRSDPDWRGCNVTIPHKIAILDHLDSVDSPELGAVNCVIPTARQLRGVNTDLLGLAEALSECDASGPIVLIGAGGAARAGMAWMKQAGAGEFRVIARDPRKGEALLAEFGCVGRVYGFEAAAEALDGAKGCLNATPLGMTGFGEMPEALLAALPRIATGGFALDMVYAPVETRFLDRAAAAGLHSIDGLAMLIGQAKSAFRLFFGEEPPFDGAEALRALLTS